MNCMAIRFGDDIVVIDAGLMFPEAELLGVDIARTLSHAGEMIESVGTALLRVELGLAQANAIEVALPRLPQDLLLERPQSVRGR